MHTWARLLLKIIIFFGLPGFAYSYLYIPMQFQPSIGQENWQLRGNPLRCGLSLTIPFYGIAYFEQFATKQPHFLIRKWQENQKMQPAFVDVAPPMWKPGGRVYPITPTRVIPGEYGIYLSKDATIQLLNFLSQGYQARIRYISEQGFPTTVAISPVKFQRVYGRFQQCLGSLLDFEYKDVAKNIFHFETDSAELNEDARKQLKKIAQYVRADDQIEKIQIIGYSDDTGRNGYNNAISEKRATAIAKYLMKAGIPKYRMNITWKGESKPVARNDTDQGRLANRRAEVTLIKK